ncbi:MAG: Maff2 family protein [Lachnospiraceae bacterium]|nr:Maff2 family protein [Lachnospiraceae bacterium]
MEFFTTAVNGLKIVVTAIGAGIGVWGVINLLEGYGQDNPASKSQGIKQLMSGGGIIIIAQTVIPQLTNLFSAS